MVSLIDLIKPEESFMLSLYFFNNLFTCNSTFICHFFCAAISNTACPKFPLLIELTFNILWFIFLDDDNDVVVTLVKSLFFSNFFTSFISSKIISELSEHLFSLIIFDFFSLRSLKWIILIFYLIKVDRYT